MRSRAVAARPSVGAAYSPLDLNAEVYWNSNASTLTDAGSAHCSVVQNLGIAGSGYNLVQTTDANRLIIGTDGTSGKPKITNSSSQWMTIPHGVALNFTDNMSAFMAGNIVNITSDAVILGKHSLTWTQAFGMEAPGGTKIGARINTADTPVVRTAAAGYTGRHLFGFTYSKAAGFIIPYWDGVAGTPIAYSTTIVNTTDPLYWFRINATYGSTGDWFAGLVAGVTLTAPQVTDLYNYLKAEHALT